MAWGWGKSIVLLHFIITHPSLILYMPGVYCMQGPHLLQSGNHIVYYMSSC